jgi:hypothetical protein
MLAAVKAQVPFKINDREVIVDGERTTVRLYDNNILDLFRKSGEIRLKGNTRVTRKSARVFNTILREFSEYHIVSKEKQWILEGPSGEKLPISTYDVVIPIISPAMSNRILMNS